MVMMTDAALVVALLVACAQGGRVYVHQEPTVEIDESTGAWTGWYDSDNPSGNGDLESVNDIYHRYMGRGCSHRVPCAAPIAMEIDLSWHHRQRFPDADLDTVLTCSALPDPNPNKGFECLNADQDVDNVPVHCLAECEANGLGQFCEDCADFEVRYFCRFDEYNCSNKKKMSAKKFTNLVKKLMYNKKQ